VKGGIKDAKKKRKKPVSKNRKVSPGRGKKGKTRIVQSFPGQTSIKARTEKRGGNNEPSTSGQSSYPIIVVGSMENDGSG